MRQLLPEVRVLGRPPQVGGVGEQVDVGARPLVQEVAHDVRLLIPDEFAFESMRLFEIVEGLELTVSA